MKINFSRHARRRIKLYSIDEGDVRNIIETMLLDIGADVGKYEKINYSLSEKYGYPLKVVFLVEGKDIIVITAYPLKREKNR
ncbi:hypothetical protein JZK55_09350 [Dissulfurispira thermophila]|uniref:DUF4258 domain-containing protein n=1 Tax=Dissulfurispira thermophila TaxID=2715679 RepID=A0A7G1H1I9_9BACT|nr:DUF4258 domain-containing protein [Dissulfurispira thermophila]BCB96013.1 hypothetical protein JZK55_09350 [Dissulfurispira thermophila]